MLMNVGLVGSNDPMESCLGLFTYFLRLDTTVQSLRWTDEFALPDGPSLGSGSSGIQTNGTQQLYRVLTNGLGFDSSAQMNRSVGGGVHCRGRWELASVRTMLAKNKTWWWLDHLRRQIGDEKFWVIIGLLLNEDIYKRINALVARHTHIILAKQERRDIEWDLYFDQLPSNTTMTRSRCILKKNPTLADISALQARWHVVQSILKRQRCDCC